MRLFFGLPIGEAAREQVSELQSRLKRTRAQVKWVQPANFHFTLRFLGEVPDSEVEQVAEAAEGTWGGRPSEEVVLRGVGAFPSLRRPRVIWVGAGDGAELIEQLYQALGERLEHALGLGREGKHFVPHLTIGRVRVPRVDPALTEAIAAMSAAEAGAFRAESFALYQSVLTHSGSVYQVIRTYAVGSETDGV